MAYVNHGTRMSIPTDKVPVGFAAPAVTPFADAKYKPVYKKLTITKATVETADRATTLLAVIQNLTVGIEKQIQDDLSADFDIVTNDLHVWIDFRNIDGNEKPSNDNDFYTNAGGEYYVEANVYAKLTVPA